MGNSIFVIMPYQWFGSWVFDDPEKGLMREPFVLGMGEMIDRITTEQGIGNSDDGFRLFFSRSMPTYTGVYHLKLMAEESGGGWYRNVETRLCGWLCPAMFLYFETLPEELFIYAEAMNDHDIKRAKAGALYMAKQLGVVVPPDEVRPYPDYKLWADTITSRGHPSLSEGGK